ncbi:uncharacterized protein [Miscanthus floridulus]|uniref:uncharacterized protein n=1 Tax=Miscanthus floridulus TaxID=154761 RepID=UPI0034580B3C
MPFKRSLVQRELDDSSSDDDDYVIFSAAQLCILIPIPKGVTVALSLAIELFIVIGKAATTGCFKDYLVVNPTYGPQIFRRRYKMSRELFLRIMNAVEAHDEYVRIGESTALESLRRFVAAVVDIFEDEYLRYPNETDTARLLHSVSKEAFLEYGIYPSWATLVKSITLPMGNKRQYLPKRKKQQGRMSRELFRFFNLDEGFVDPDERFDYGGENVQPAHGQATRTLMNCIDAHKRIRDKETHVQLKEDLIEHLWEPLS